MAPHPLASGASPAGALVPTHRVPPEDSDSVVGRAQILRGHRSCLSFLVPPHRTINSFLLVVRQNGGGISKGWPRQRSLRTGGSWSLHPSTGHLFLLPQGCGSSSLETVTGKPPFHPQQHPGSQQSPQE